MYNPVFFLSTSVTELSAPRFGTGTDKQGNAIFVLVPKLTVVDIPPLATQTVFAVVTEF